MTDSVDIIVIGGGINGAAIAQAAAAANYEVLILEQAPGLAWGTSSKSSKLIHGGLRYLEQGQFSLVRESLKERALLLRNAPGLVKLIPFFIPVYRTSQRSPLTIRAGLGLYSLLGGLSRENFFRSLPKSQWAKLDGLRTRGLRAVFQYYEAQTDDVALTCAVMGSARELGARLLTDAKVTDIQLDEAGALVTYQHRSRPVGCRARVTVNAAGAWVNDLLAKVSPPISPPDIDLVQGTHILLGGKPPGGAYYAESPRDGRAVFIMPWQGRTLIGTTETPYLGDPTDVRPLDAEIDYLLETFAHYFPSRPSDRSCIDSAFAGLRVLPKTDERAFARPREAMFLPDRDRAPRLLSIYGGKLTVHRATAEKVLAAVRASLPPRRPLADTRSLTLSAAGADQHSQSQAVTHSVGKLRP